MNEYEFEPIRGLPELPPQGEKIVWQGEPGFMGISRRVFHVRKVGLYFAIVLAFSLASQSSSGEPFSALLATVAWQLAIASAALGILFFLGWLYTRTTVYTITNQRLVMRFGVAMPMMINIPWSRIAEVNLRDHGDGSGDIELTMSGGQRMSYLMLWPHIRPWQFSPVKPTLRSINNVQAVAADLAKVLQTRFPQATTHAPDWEASPRPDLDLPARARAAGAP